MDQPTQMEPSSTTLLEIVPRQHIHGVCYCSISNSSIPITFTTYSQTRGRENRGESSSQARLANVSIVGKQISILTVMENGTNNHLLLVEAIEIVKKVTFEKTNSKKKIPNVLWFHMLSSHVIECYLFLHVSQGIQVYLIIIDMLEGLPVPNDFTPSNVIPPWNSHKHDNFDILFNLLMLTIWCRRQSIRLLVVNRM